MLEFVYSPVKFERKWGSVPDNQPDPRRAIAFATTAVAIILPISSVGDKIGISRQQ